MTAAGIREANFPDETETLVIMQFIRNNYPMHTAGEVRLAFDQAVSGKLDVDAVAYENFSMLYFGKVMSAFRKWAGEEHRQRMAENGINKAQESNEMKESVDWSKEWSSIVKQAKNGLIRKEFINTDIYDWLMKTKAVVDEETGEVIPMYDFTPHEKWIVIHECMHQYHRELREALAMNQDRGAINPPDILKLVEYMEFIEVDSTGKVIDPAPWKKNEVIMSTLIVMAKQEFCRQIAVLEATEL